MKSETKPRANRSNFIRVPGVGRIYKHGRQWYLDYWVDGARVRERGSHDKEMALQMLAAKKADAERGEVRFEKKTKVHFADFVEEYKKAKAEKRSHKSIEGYTKPLVSFFGDLPLSKITSELVEAYKQKRLKTEKKASANRKKEQKILPCPQYVKGATVNRELACLKNIFTIATKNKKFHGSNPVKGIDFCPEQPRDYVLSRDEVSRLLSFSNDVLKKVIMIALNTGLRKGEILSLKWSQVNFDDGFISIARTKSAKYHRVPMNEIVVDILSGINREGDFVFMGKNQGGHLRDCKRPFETARKKAGLPGLHFHDLRHCAGTYMATAGVPLATVQQILGHKDIRTTMRYVNPNDDSRRKAVNVLAAIFADPGKATGTNVAQEEKRSDATIEISTN